jgi:hypothetical protein
MSRTAVETGAWSAYWSPKAGTPRAEWEDGCAYSPSTGWFAVTDGASSGTRSREWAFHLARSFVDAGQLGAFSRWDVPAFLRWTEETRTAFDSASDEYSAYLVADWIQAASASKGAFATLLGGHIAADEWQVVAVGDCCLFHVSAAGELLTTFPLAAGHDPAAAPMLVASVSNGDRRLAEGVHFARGFLALGDSLFVTTDALAAWVFTRLAEPETWRALRRIGATGFEHLCADLRSTELMKNDDVTMLRFTSGTGQL